MGQLECWHYDHVICFVVFLTSFFYGVVVETTDLY